MDSQLLPVVGRQVSHTPVPPSKSPPSMPDLSPRQDEALLSSHDALPSVDASITTKLSPGGTGYHPVGGGTQASRRTLASTALCLVKNWWEEVLCCIISVACVAALAAVLSAYDGQPLPAWPLGITLNTVVAFLTTVCRTLFIIPAAGVLSQAKWNWFKKFPRPLTDLSVFDDASRGSWGSLKLLVATKGRLIGVLAAILQVTSLATSTLTQSVITYPTRPIPVAGNDTALSSRNDGYFWVSANSQSRRDAMFPINQMIPRAVYTPPEEVLPYETPTCSTNNCTWSTFSSLAVCVDMKNATDQLHVDTEHVAEGTNWTLPNGARMTFSEGYGNMNISTAPTLSYNGTEIQKAFLFDFFVMYVRENRARAVEIALHWCVDTYDVTVNDNIPAVRQVSSQTIVLNGEVFVREFNETINGTYLVTPNDPGATYVADGHGPGEIWRILNTTLSGYSVDYGGYEISNANSLFETAIARAAIGVTSQQGVQILDDREWVAMRNVSQNIANGLTNAMLNLKVYGTAWERESFVSVRWPWLSLVVVQVGLAIITLIFAIFQTATLDIGVVKRSLLPALFAIDAREKAALETEFLDGEDQLPLGEKTGLDAHGISGELRRGGTNWVLGENA